MLNWSKPHSSRSVPNAVVHYDPSRVGAVLCGRNHRGCAVYIFYYLSLGIQVPSQKVFGVAVEGPSAF